MSKKLLKIIKGACIAGAAAGGIYALQSVGELDLGPFKEAAVAVAAILINILRTFNTTNQ